MIEEGHEQKLEKKCDQSEGGGRKKAVDTAAVGHVELGETCSCRWSS